MVAKSPAVTAARLTAVLKDTIVGTVRKGSDLSARQLAILLITQLDKMQSSTVRGLAEALEISKPAVTRSLDRLSELGLVRRLPDPSDRRSVLVGRTRAGDAYIAMLREFVTEAAQRALAPAPVLAIKAREVWA